MLVLKDTAAICRTQRWSLEIRFEGEILRTTMKKIVLYAADLQMANAHFEAPNQMKQADNSSNVARQYQNVSQMMEGKRLHL